MESGELTGATDPERPVRLQTKRGRSAWKQRGVTRTARLRRAVMLRWAVSERLVARVARVSHDEDVSRTQYGRKVAPKVREGVVQKKQRHHATAALGFR